MTIHLRARGPLLRLLTILKILSPDWVKYNERDNFGELSDKSEFMKVMEEFDANVKIN